MKWLTKHRFSYIDSAVIVAISHAVVFISPWWFLAIVPATFISCVIEVFVDTKDNPHE